MKRVLVDAMGTFVIEGEGIYQPLYELLETYPNPKIVLTMAPDNKMVEWGLNDLPYEVYTTRLDPRKTDPAYYSGMLAQYGLAAEDVVYFEHNPEAIKAAESVGITSHFYDENVKDVEAVKAFLDTNL